MLFMDEEEKVKEDNRKILQKMVNFAEKMPRFSIF